MRSLGFPSPTHAQFSFWVLNGYLSPPLSLQNLLRILPMSLLSPSVNLESSLGKYTLHQCLFSHTHKSSLVGSFLPSLRLHWRWGFFHSTGTQIFGKSDECGEFHSAALSDCTSPNSPHSFIKDENPVTIETAVLHALTALSLKALPQCCYKILFSFFNVINH